MERKKTIANSMLEKQTVEKTNGKINA